MKLESGAILLGYVEFKTIMLSETLTVCVLMMFCEPLHVKIPFTVRLFTFGDIVPDVNKEVTFVLFFPVLSMRVILLCFA